MKNTITIIVFLFMSISLKANEIEVTGTITNPSCGPHGSCGYFSSMDGEFNITYRNTEIKWGSHVLLKYAYGDGFNPQKEWVQEKLMVMPAINKSTWGANFKDQVAARGSYGYSKLKFIFIILNPDMTTSIDKGSDSSLGYYQVQLPYSSEPDALLEVEAVSNPQ